MAGILRNAFLLEVFEKISNSGRARFPEKVN
jgi:hypothetical protein